MVCKAGLTPDWRKTTSRVPKPEAHDNVLQFEDRERYDGAGTSNHRMRERIPGAWPMDAVSCAVLAFTVWAPERMHSGTRAVESGSPSRVRFLRSDRSTAQLATADRGVAEGRRDPHPYLSQIRKSVSESDAGNWKVRLNPLPDAGVPETALTTGAGGEVALLPAAPHAYIQTADDA